MDKLISEGKCIFCDKTFEKAGISRHLNTHLKEMQTTGKKGKSFHIRVEAFEMFLNLWVDAKQTMGDIDDFLRAIWLECCGHMSSFTNPKKRHEAEMSGSREIDFFSDSIDDIFGEGEILMDEKCGDVFTKGLLLKYEYDFGSTTCLNIKVMEEINMSPPEPLILLSRNEPLEILCGICKKEIAVKICPCCIDYTEGLFCKACAKTHRKNCIDFSDVELPVVNSPRMGVCGYDGGTIDTERDGVYKKKKIGK